jgi:hypothetical protein
LIPNTINIQGANPFDVVSNPIYYYAEAIIGLRSGLSWINWALEKHTVYD